METNDKLNVARPWMLVYTIAFGLLSIAFVYDDVENKYNVIYVLEGIFIFLLVFIGNLIYSLDFITQKIRMIWKFAFPIIILDFVVSDIIDDIYGKHAQNKSVELMSLATLLNIALFLPTFWAHYKIGYGKKAEMD
jgi:hypothetical protein